MKHKSSKNHKSVPKKSGNMHKAKSPAMGMNMGRTAAPMMGATAPWGGMNPMPGGGMAAC